MTLVQALLGIAKISYSLKVSNIHYPKQEVAYTQGQWPESTAVWVFPLRSKTTVDVMQKESKQNRKTTITCEQTVSLFKKLLKVWTLCWCSKQFFSLKRINSHWLNITMLKNLKKVVGLKQETFQIYSSQSVISAIRLSNYLSSIKYKKVIL